MQASPVFAQTASPQVLSDCRSLRFQALRLTAAYNDSGVAHTHFVHCNSLWMQVFADLAEQGFGNIKPESRDETRGLPLSDSRYPKGAAIPGDEEKIR